jgi:hypothetical protein
MIQQKKNICPTIGNADAFLGGSSQNFSNQKETKK